jgi:hypothetical protein
MRELRPIAPVRIPMRRWTIFVAIVGPGQVGVVVGFEWMKVAKNIFLNFNF